MRVLHFHNDLDIGGTQKTLEQFCIELALRDIECCVSYFSDGAKHRLANLDGKHNIYFYEIDRGDKQACFEDLMDLFQPDIVHVYRGGCPVFPEPGEDFDLGNAKFVETNVFGLEDRNSLISKTLYMSEYLQKYIARTRGKRYDYIYNPIPLPLTQESMLKVPLNGYTVLGRSGRPENGIYDSISVEAISYLMRKHPDFNPLFLVLSPPQNMIRDMDAYKIPYQIVDTTVDDHELDQFYNAIDIFCHARLDGETCGCCIQEAMMHGKPVVTHVARPKNPTVFPFQAQCTIVDEKVGFAVQHSIEDYAEAIWRLVKNPQLRIDMGMAGKDKAMKLFASGVCTEKLLKIYHEVLNEQD